MEDNEPTKCLTEREFLTEIHKGLNTVFKEGKSNRAVLLAGLVAVKSLINGRLSLLRDMDD